MLLTKHPNPKSMALHSQMMPPKVPKKGLHSNTAQLLYSKLPPIRKETPYSEDFPSKVESLSIYSKNLFIVKKLLFSKFFYSGIYYNQVQQNMLNSF